MASRPNSRFELPRIFVACAGRDRPELPLSGELGVFLGDLDLPALADIAGPGGWLSPFLHPVHGGHDQAPAAPLDVDGGTARRATVALDLDTVEGLNADDAAARFAILRLGFPIIATRRPAVAVSAAEAGGLGLVQVFAFDSTGLGRSLEGHPRREGTGCVVSPGPVLSHMTEADRSALPRPLVAHGLVATPALARTALRFADAIVVAPDCVTAILEEARAARSTAAPGGPNAA